MRYAAVIAAGLLLAAGPAAAQTPAGSTPTERVRPGRPVDQTVGDLDPKSRSLRRIEPGTGRFSSRVSLYQRVDPADWQKQQGSDGAADSRLDRPYVYRAPGVEALVDQPQYLTPRGLNRPSTGDRFRQIITPNTVFNLIPEQMAGTEPRSAGPASTAQNPQNPRSAEANPHRVSTRYSTRLPGRIDGKIPESRRLAERIAAWQSEKPADARQAPSEHDPTSRIKPPTAQQQRIEAARRAAPSR